jgi:adenylate cyclase
MRQRSPFLVIAFSVLLLGALLSLARQQGYLQYLEMAAYDLLLASTARGFATPPAVSLLLISEADIQQLGNWPLSDAQLDDILTRIVAMRPQVVGIDIYRDLEVPPGTQALQALLRDEPRIVAIEKFPGAGSPGVPPPPVLRGSDRVGFSDLVTDRGGVARRSLLFLSDGNRTGYAFSLRLALAYLAAQGIYPAPGESDPSHIRLGNVTLPPLEGNEGGYVNADAGGYQVMLRYHGGPAPFPVYTLQDLRRGGIPPGEIENRIVIVGVAAESVKDYFTTPFSILDRTAGSISGSVVHAHAAQQLLDAAIGGRQALRSWPDAGELAWMWTWIGLGFLAGWFAGPSWRFVLVIVAGVAAAVALAAVAYMQDWWIPVVPNLLGWLFAAALSSALLAAHRRRDQLALMSLFSRHVSPEVAAAIWQRRDEVLDDGGVRPRTLTVTTLFTDLQGFTQVSGQMEPEPFLEWLNSYMSVLTDVIMQHGGVLDDYAGDGIKASFGIPFCDPTKHRETAVRAVECALHLGRALTGLNREWRSQGRACVAMRVGIHTGPVVVGTLGSKSRMKYTTVGRNVNLASRIEGLKDCACPDPDDEARNCRILVSESTAALVADAFALEDIGVFELKGITEKIRVFAIIESKSKEHEHADD